jgi:3-dehydroquinate synthase II
MVAWRIRGREDDGMAFDKAQMHLIAIDEIRPLGQGDRVCVDMLSNFGEGHGLLVGAYNRALFLVHCETIPNQFVNQRPARVNAGPVSMYVMCANGSTKYLNELQPGDELLTVNARGDVSSNRVARSKIEPRPMLLVRGTHRVSGADLFRLHDESAGYFDGYRTIFRLKDVATGNPVSVLEIDRYRGREEGIRADLDVGTILQDAETIPLVREDGAAISVKKLQAGDRVWAYIQNPKLQSRHFGMAYEGFCLER